MNSADNPIAPFQILERLCLDSAEAKLLEFSRTLHDNPPPLPCDQTAREYLTPPTGNYQQWWNAGE
ncbi:MAG: hypothetical protein GY814_16800 [Gammaproteobacteria bacterium]|nr:hypothetical protein [Gammaproteobacteria bacterium]